LTCPRSSKTSKSSSPPARTAPCCASGSATLTPQANDWPKAIGHLRRAVELDPLYSAAWKLLGKSLTAAGDREGAVEVYRQGIVVAEQKGDKQTLKEMQVFLRRLAKPES
jgi:Flp pilus assembly protein TadD